MNGNKSPGKSKKWQLVAAYGLIWLTVSAIFAVLYNVTRHSLINEIRCHAMGVAIATAAGINADDLEQIRSPDDTAKESYRRIQEFIGQVARFNPDVRYIYTMRRVRGPTDDSSGHSYHFETTLLGKCWYEFIVDEPAKDNNGNGRIDPGEQCELPGKRYDASAFPELVAAWNRPAADFDIAPDPPYPDLMSGYAPVRGTDGRTVAIVGVDITAGTIAKKIFAVRIALVSGALLCVVLLSLLLHLYFHKVQLLAERDKLVAEIQDALDHVKTLRGLLPVCSYCKKVRNDKGYWEQIEEYLTEHSQAEFTHGVCPECMLKFPKEACSREDVMLADK